MANADGSNIHQLINGFQYISKPRWSPDGKRIAFSAYLEEDKDADRDREIFVINSDGTGLHQITNNENIDDFLVDWSPDGKELLYESYLFDGVEIFVINADGTDLRQSTIPMRDLIVHDGLRMGLK